MKVSFRTISGKSYSKIFNKVDTVQDAISFLMQELTINDDKIFLISFEKNRLFYEVYEKLEHTGHKIFAFLNLFDTGNEQPMRKSKMAMPSNNILSTMKTINYLKNNKIRSEERKIYDQYSSTLRREPKDLPNRINQLAQLGYDQNDCLEALRQNNYDVTQAAQYITHIFSSSFYRKPTTRGANANKNYIRNERGKPHKEKNRPISAQKQSPPPIRLQKQKTDLSPHLRSPPSQILDQIGNSNTKQKFPPQQISPPREKLFVNQFPTKNRPPAQKNIMKNQTDETKNIEIKPPLANNGIRYSNQNLSNQNRPKPPLKRYSPKY